MARTRNRRRILPPPLTGGHASLYRRCVRTLKVGHTPYFLADLTVDRRPFRRVYTGIDKTGKRALPLHMIRTIRLLPLPLGSTMGYARDMFVLSFMLRGMSFVDMAYLRKSDLLHGRITYRRRKTGQMLIVAWKPQVQKILDKYPPNHTRYLLPIIKHYGIHERYAYRNAVYNINRSLHKIGVMLGLEAPLTMYVARHSWVSAARSRGIPVSVISEGMGHDSESTTRIYLASLEASVVDDANARILAAL